MKRKWITCLIVVLCLTFGFSTNTLAFSKDYSASKKSTQWQVHMDQGDNSDNKTTVYNRYHYHTLTIKNTGGPVSNVKVNGLKGNPDVKENVSANLSDKELAKGNVMKSKEFPLYFNTTKFVVEISWHSEKDGENHKKKFTFKEGS